MDKSYLEKKIEEIAEDEVEREWKEFINNCSSHPIGRYLKINGKRLFGGQSDGHSDEVMSYSIVRLTEDIPLKNSNALDAIRKRKQEIIEKRTIDLLNKISEIGHLFEEK